ncbi:LEM domain protein family member (lem-3)-like protein, partial [Aphelenchoides avenae]
VTGVDFTLSNMNSRKFAKHIKAGKCSAALAAKHAAIEKSKEHRSQLPKRGKRAAALEEEYPVARILEHRRAVDVGLEDRYTAETTLYRVRWADDDGKELDETEDTFEPETHLRDIDVFEAYISQNCDHLSRHLMPTDETMRPVNERLDLGHREIMYIGPLKDARQNVKKHFTRGPKVADWLQVTYRSRQRLAKWQGDWRLVYLLLDASSPGLHPGCDLLAFGRAVFYVGKGLASRPFDHFKEAKAYLLSPYSAEPTPMAERIADIWRAGHGVIPVPVISKLCDEDIKCREAALINLKRAGLTNLVNTASGSFAKNNPFKNDDWMELGVMQLVSAFNLYGETDPRALYISDGKLSIDQIETWHAVCPTPYQPALLVEGPSTPSAHSSAAAANPTGIANKVQVSKYLALRRTSSQQTSTSVEQVSFGERRVVQQVGEVGGTSAQGSSTGATADVARPQNTVPEAAAAATPSRQQGWHAELTEESRRVQREELVKCASQFEEAAYGSASSRGRYYALVMEGTAAMRRVLNGQVGNGASRGPVANLANTPEYAQSSTHVKSFRLETEVPCSGETWDTSYDTFPRVYDGRTWTLCVKRHHRRNKNPFDYQVGVEPPRSLPAGLTYSFKPYKRTSDEDVTYNTNASIRVGASWLSAAGCGPTVFVGAEVTLTTLSEDRVFIPQPADRRNRPQLLALEDPFNKCCRMCQAGSDVDTRELLRCGCCTLRYHRACHVPEIEEDACIVEYAWRCSICVPCDPLTSRTRQEFGPREQLLSAKAFLATGFENRTIARCISLRLYRDPCDFIDNVVDALTKRANANDVQNDQRQASKVALEKFGAAVCGFLPVHYGDYSLRCSIAQNKANCERIASYVVS